MNINKFKYVTAIAKYQNMTRAAESLYMSQPALTKSLTQLERELGVRLFDRDYTPIRLTYAGELFLDEAEKILNLYEHLMDEMNRIATSQKSRLRLGITSDRGTVWLPYLIPAFSRHFPNIDLQTIEGTHPDVENLLLDGKVDLGFTTLPVSSSQIASDVVADDPIVIACSREHPFARNFDLSRNTLTTPYLISPKDLEGQKFLALNKGTQLRRLSEFMFERNGLYYRFIREFRRHETAMRVAAEGVGLIVTPSQTAVRLGISDRFAYFSIERPVLSRKIIFAYPASTGIGIHGRYLTELVKTLGREHGLLPEAVEPIEAIPAGRGRLY